MKLSQWHKSNIKPVHIGVYQRFLPHSYSYWDGRKWHIHSRSPQEAEDRKSYNTSIRNVEWRGIVK